MPVSDVAQVQDGKLRTPVGQAPVIPLLLILIGGYLAWFAVHYWRDQKTKWPTDVVKDVLQGKGVPVPDPAPSAATTLASVESGAGSPGTVGSESGQAIAADAEKYIGAGYVWGGAPAQGIGHWDCSSFCNWVIGHDLHLAIPGDQHYTGQSHGPDVASWIAWNGVEHIGPTGTVQAGDVLAWGPNQHMGIAVSSTQFVSAANPKLGVIKADIASWNITFPFVLRLRAVSGPDTPPATGTAARNQKIASVLASAHGWAAYQDQNQWDSLVALWTRESGWSNTAENPSSGAYGIAQALGHGPSNQYPGGQYKAANPPPLGTSSARVQILWGLWYIQQTYGDPATAWQHEQQAGWY